MQLIFLILSSILSIYIIILILRVLISWFTVPNPHQLLSILSFITDWYLNIFKRIKRLKYGLIDFSPVLAILILQTISLIFRYLGIASFISLKTILVSLGLALWNALIAIIVFFGLIAFLRLIFLFLAKRNQPHFVEVLDELLDPLTDLLTHIPLVEDTPYFVHLLLLIFLGLAFGLIGILLVEPLLFHLLF